MKTAAIIFALVAAAYAQDCGVPAIDPIEDGRGRIVNGIEARPNSFPWQVAQCRGASSLSCSLICGGSIIRANVLLSAAHCVVGQSASQIGFKYGAHSLRDSSADGQGIARVQQFRSHPDYNSQQIFNDIAIVILRENLEFSDKVQPICLANTDDHLAEGEQMYDIGWGRLGGNAPVSDRLQQTILVHHTRETCLDIFGGNLHPSCICCGGLADLKSVCFGDSGGPYFKKDNVDNRYYQYGINSFVTSSACAQVDRPNGMSRVPFLCGYLESVMGENPCLTPPESSNSLKFHNVNKLEKFFA